MPPARDLTDRLPLPIDTPDTGGWSEDEPGVAAAHAARPGLDGLLDFARDRLIAMVADARDSLVAQVRSLTGIADLITENLPEGAAPVAGLVDTAAASVNQIADALAEKSVEELVDDGRALVRAQPAAALGVAIAVGFLAGRMLKATRD